MSSSHVPAAAPDMPVPLCHLGGAWGTLLCQSRGILKGKRQRPCKVRLYREQTTPPFRNVTSLTYGISCPPAARFQRPSPVASFYCVLPPDIRVVLEIPEIHGRLGIHSFLGKSLRLLIVGAYFQGLLVTRGHIVRKQAPESCGNC